MYMKQMLCILFALQSMCALIESMEKSEPTQKTQPPAFRIARAPSFVGNVLNQLPQQNMFLLVIPDSKQPNNFKCRALLKDDNQYFEIGEFQLERVSSAFFQDGWKVIIKAEQGEAKTFTIISAQQFRK
jgi:hypothetical protein